MADIYTTTPLGTNAELAGISTSSAAAVTIFDAPVGKGQEVALYRVAGSAGNGFFRINGGEYRPFLASGVGSSITLTADETGRMTITVIRPSDAAVDMTGIHCHRV
jgi:hypothetical protein